MLGFVSNFFVDFGNNKIVSFSEDCCLALDTQVTVGNLLFYGNDFIFIFWVKIFFSFGKITLDVQDTYFRLGLLLGTFGTSI